MIIIAVLADWNSPGGVESEILDARLKVAFTEYQTARSIHGNHGVFLVVSGGFKKTWTVSEANAMYWRFVNLGVCGENILTDHLAQNTLEQLEGIIRAIHQEFPKPTEEILLRIVTHIWHEPRVLAYWSRSDRLHTHGIYMDINGIPSTITFWKRLWQITANIESRLDPNRRILDFLRIRVRKKTV